MKVTHARITKTAIERLGPNEVIRDNEAKGFGARSREKVVTYFVEKKVRGRRQWVTIGRHGSPWTAETARKKASSLLIEMAGGGDPAERLRREREALTFDEAQKRFMEQHGPKLKPRTRTEYQRLLDKIIGPRFGKQRLHEITRADVTQFHAELGRVPGRANFALSVLSKLFSWAQDTGIDPRDSNPCIRVAKFRLSKRERYLTREEYALIATTVEVLESEGRITTSSAYAIRLLMLTGARLNEILTLQWSFVRADMKSLFLPDSKTGEKIIRLSDEVLAVLNDIPKIKGNPYVITGHVTGTHLTNLHKAWYLVCQTANLEGVRIHDLRHSFASMAADAGASLPMIGGLLGHADPQTTARYVHLVDKRLHELNGTVGAAISSAMKGEVKVPRSPPNSTLRPGRSRARSGGRWLIIRSHKMAGSSGYGRNP